jgi:hypothetical protein
MKLLAKLIARALFALRGPWSAIRANAGIVALLLVASQWVLRTAGVSALGTFIDASGTTAQSFNIAGPNGPTWTNSSGTSTISATSQMIVDSNAQATLGGDNASTVNVGTNSTAEPGINIGDQTGSATNIINIGSATGTSTINIQSAASGPPSGYGLNIQSANFNLNQPGFPGPNDGITFGAVSGFSASVSASGFQGSLDPTEFTTTGTFLDVDAPNINIGPSGGLSGGGTVTIGNSQVAPTTTTLVLTSGSTINYDYSGLPIFQTGATGFMPNGTNGGLGHGCGTGNTFTMPANIFGFKVTTGTLTSNCVLNFATNCSNGMYLIDLSGATPGATFGITFENGTATRTILSTTAGNNSLAIVWTYGANTLAVAY